MLEQKLQQTCRELLEAGTVKVVIGYGATPAGQATRPVFITTPDAVNKLVWNNRCEANLVAYLKRPDVRALGKPAIVVKACDERALVVLQQEQQVDRANLYVIGMACDGIGSPLEAKCRTCGNHVPRFCDVVLGESAQPAGETGKRWEELEEFLKKSSEERMAYWQKELARCGKCYACRQVCPLCYCERCIVDKNRPTSICTSPSLKGNFAWHVTRAFHLAARCVGCDACTRACPAGINLRLLNQSMARAAEDNFQFRPGTDPQAEPLIGNYAQGDKEDFIR